MFTHKAIAELNALELMVYNYVSKHKNQVMYMTIRELAEAARRVHHHRAAILQKNGL
ncbi:Uncharacterised protein [Serratia marcescens]|uniref:Uncharacterized protein n=1 Tax=Serratia marcescens TaxID=615 RepID=A0A379ZJ91_SERMA|nr:Uncharacterised protein [Serratia marcescens]